MTELTRQKGQEAGASSDIENPGWARWQQRLEGAPPSGPLERCDGMMPRVMVISWRIRIPVIANLFG
jgi:hypothetical protein